MLTLESHALSSYQAALCGFETAESLHEAERMNFKVEIINLAVLRVVQGFSPYF